MFCCGFLLCSLVSSVFYDFVLFSVVFLRFPYVFLWFSGVSRCFPLVYVVFLFFPLLFCCFLLPSNVFVVFVMDVLKNQTKTKLFKCLLKLVFGGGGVYILMPDLSLLLFLIRLVADLEVLSPIRSSQRLFLIHH